MRLGVREREGGRSDRQTGRRKGGKLDREEEGEKKKDKE